MTNIYSAGVGEFFPGFNPGFSTLTNSTSVPQDPLFYLHHAGLDRVWWQWQIANDEGRLFEISGYTTQTGNEPVTLDFVMDFPGLGPNVTVREVMDPRVWPGCFVYEY